MKTDATVITFAPQHWGWAERFAHLYGTSFPNFTRVEHRAVSGAVRHAEKAFALRRIVRRLVSTLKQDTAELEEHGYTPARNARDLSALIETIFLEMYSALDCTRKVIVATHRKTQGMPANSTRRLFQSVQSGELDGALPAYLTDAIKGVVWFQELRRLRDEITHLDVGHCSLNPGTDTVSYLHAGLGDHARAFVIDDILGWIDVKLDELNLFMGRVFRYLNTLLNQEPVFQLCGIFSGRIYSRNVIASEVTDFNSGVCTSLQWFELEGNPTCPFVGTCAAYRKAKELSVPHSSG